MNACRYSYTRTRLYWLGFDVTASNMRDGIAYSKSRFFLQFVYRRRIQPERPHAKVDPVKLELSRRASDVS